MNETKTKEKKDVLDLLLRNVVNRSRKVKTWEDVDKDTVYRYAESLARARPRKFKPEELGDDEKMEITEIVIKFIGLLCKLSNLNRQNGFTLSVLLTSVLVFGFYAKKDFKEVLYGKMEKLSFREFSDLFKELASFFTMCSPGMYNDLKNTTIRSLFEFYLGHHFKLNAELAFASTGDPEHYRESCLRYGGLNDYSLHNNPLYIRVMDPEDTNKRIAKSISYIYNKPVIFINNITEIVNENDFVYWFNGGRSVLAITRRAPGYFHPRYIPMTKQLNLVLVGTTNEENKKNVFNVHVESFFPNQMELTVPTEEEEEINRLVLLKNNRCLLYLESLKNILGFFVSLGAISKKTMYLGDVSTNFKVSLSNSDFVIDLMKGEMDDEGDSEKLKKMRRMVGKRVSGLISSKAFGTFTDDICGMLPAGFNQDALGSLIATLDIGKFYLENVKNSGDIIMDYKTMIEICLRMITYYIPSFSDVEKGLIESGYTETYNNFMKFKPTVIKTGDRLDLENKVSYSQEYVNYDIDIDHVANVLKKGYRAFGILYGPTGTGKTEFVKKIAEKTQREIVEIDPSHYRKKYVGDDILEVKSLFNDAKNKNAIVLVDEAETIIGERANSDAEWTRSLVNYILTVLDKREIDIFFTTNFIKDVDKAVLRRINLKVEFKELSSSSKTKLLKEVCSKFSIKTTKKILSEYERRLEKITLTVGVFNTTLNKLVFSKKVKIEDVVRTLEEESGMLFPGSNKRVGF